jgi:hypothetical protein
MPRFIRALIVSGFCLTCAAAALAESFFLRYDADATFPEQEGWSHWTSNPEAPVQRTVEDSVFRLNSMASPGTADLYDLRGPDLIPGPGEFLRVDWRMRVLQQADTGLDWFGDAGMAISAADYEGAFLNLAPNLVSVSAPGTQGYSVLSLLEPGTWYTYSFLTNLQQCDLFVDGRLVFHGVLYTSAPETPHPWISWGDPWSGTGSDSEWDYVQVSIVPEPGTILAALLAAATACRRRSMLL